MLLNAPLAPQLNLTVINEAEVKGHTQPEQEDVEMFTFFQSGEILIKAEVCD